MKFIINGGTLSHSLNSVMGLIAKNNTIPIVENFLFVLKENTLSISATDLETLANINIELQQAEAMGKNAVCVPAKEFSSLVNQLKAIPLTIFVNEDYSIDIVTSEGKYSFKGLEPDDYPQMTQIEDANVFTINSAMLVKAINKTIFATSTDDFRPQMSGVFLEFSQKGLTFVGTDSHKLVRFRNVTYATEDARGFILPKKTLNIIQRILSSVNEDIEVKVENNTSNIAFYFGNYIISCRLIDGKYPRYEEAIPVDNPNKLIVNSSALISTIKRVQIFSNPTTYKIRIAVTDKRLTITAEDSNYGTRGKEELPCSYEGEPMELGLNAKFLLELLNNVETEDVCIETSRPNRPCIVLPYEETEEENSNSDESLLMLIMPVLL
ncbi:MAG: DNA polymerase III subunit beta [Bacteroidales bacterium]|nr:DNA polymerase III subunit beta [Bacteroidales bacterium]